MGRLILERETRFELATSTLARLHSTTELFPHVFNDGSCYRPNLEEEIKSKNSFIFIY